MRSTPGALHRLRASQGALLAGVVVAVVFVVTYASTVAVKPLFAPDSRYYAAMALWFGGVTQSDAARQVAEVSALSGWASPEASALFGWGLVQPRVVLPALSVPFVKVWGIDGLVVVPGLALAALMAVLAWMLSRRYGTVAGVATTVLIMCSSQIMFYGSAMLTESLSALWGALVMVAAWRYHKHRSWVLVALMVALTVVSAFTRQATFIVAGALVVAWLAALILRDRPERWALPALSVGFTAVAVQILQTKLFPTFSQLDQFKSKTGAETLTEALAGMPALAWHIVSTDLMYFVRSDRPLLVLITLSIVSGVVFWRRAETHLLIGALAGCALYGITNGTPTAFRYAMPGLVFFATSVAMLMSRLVPRVAPADVRSDDPDRGQPSSHRSDRPDEQHPDRRAARAAVVPDDRQPRDRRANPEGQTPTDATTRS